MLSGEATAAAKDTTGVVESIRQLSVAEGNTKKEAIRCLKRCLPREIYRALRADLADLATLGWVHWYNTVRIHGYLNDLSPDEYEAAYTATTTDHNKTENHNIQPAQNPG